MERTVTFGGKPVKLMGNQIKVGDKAPNFLAYDMGISPVELASDRGKNIIISVVPSVDTEVCAAQTRRFNEEAASLKDTVIYTISVDLPFALKRFCAAEGIDAVKTLSDHRKLDFGMKYGFAIEELRILARGIVIVNKKGSVVYVEYVDEIAHHPDYEKALEIARDLE